eukprot:6214028-Pleurochrysis_carterae.AAC.5
MCALHLLLPNASPHALLVQALHLRLELGDDRGVLLVCSTGSSIGAFKDGRAAARCDVCRQAVHFAARSVALLLILANSALAYLTLAVACTSLMTREPPQLLLLHPHAALRLLA